MKYSLVLIRDDGQEPPEFRPLGSFSTEVPEPDLENRLATELFGRMAEIVAPPDLQALGAPATYRPGKQTGRPARVVLIDAMDDDSQVHTLIRPGATYTTTDLSRLLGYNFNRVTQVMNDARKKRETLMADETDPVERAKISADPVSATLRGVTFHFLDETAGVDKID